MNKLELICDIEELADSSEEKTKFLTHKLRIDGKLFNRKHPLDLNALADSCKFTGEFDILTCGCGIAGCAGIFEGIHVVHGEDAIIWRVPKPLCLPSKKPPRKVTYTEYLFDRNQYVEALRTGVERGKRLLWDHDNFEYELIRTVPHGFTTYDFFQLNMSHAGFYSTKINRALGFSAKAHLTQLRKGTDIPYVTHPFAVGMILANAGCAEDVVVAGILHDTVEDSEVTLDMISAEFGEYVARIVARCSEPDKTLSWEERKQHTLDEMKKAPLEVQFVACADKLHNISTMIEEQRRSGDEIWKRFKRGRAQQGWYFHGLLDSFAKGQIYSHPLYKEFKLAIESLFGSHSYPDDVIHQIVSGGQTGVDRAALDVAMNLRIVTGGWCPAGRRAEDGVIPERYPLQETKAKNYAVRTRWNVRDSDGTLVLTSGELSDGTLKTVEYACKAGKPCLVVQLDHPDHPDSGAIKDWLLANSIRTLNVAGPRESKRPGIYRQSTELLQELFGQCLLDLEAP